MKIKLYLLSIALPIIIYSCERSIDMKLPYSGDKIVVNAVMKSDSMLIARITRSLPPEDDGRTTSYDSTNARELKPLMPKFTRTGYLSKNFSQNLFLERSTTYLPTYLKSRKNIPLKPPLRG